MKLTVKDKDFLEKLKSLLEAKELKINLKEDGLKRFVLRQNYGDKVEKCFGMTRQGVRWRFNRLFNEVYVEAYQAIFWVESHFGTELRSMTLEIAKERVALRKKACQKGFFEVYRRETNGKEPIGGACLICKGNRPPKKSILEGIQGVNNPLRPKRVCHITFIVAHHRRGIAVFAASDDFPILTSLPTKKF